MLVFGNGFKLTTKGAQMVSSGAAYSFTRIVLGSGTYTANEAYTGRTGLKNQKQSFNVSTPSIDGTTVTIPAVVNNTNLTEGYTITEIGIMAKDSSNTEHLFLIGVATVSDPMPAHSDNVPDVVCDIKVKYTTNNTAAVSLVVPQDAVARANDLQAEAALRQQQFNSLNQTKVNKGAGEITPSDFSQAAKEMMTGGSVAVVGTGSVGIQNVDNAVAKLIGGYVSQDIVYVNGYVNQSTGILSQYGSYKTVYYDCSPGDRLKISTCVSGNNAALVVCFDNVGSYVSSYKPGESSINHEYTDEDYMIPPGVVKIGVSTSSSSLYPVSIKKMCVAEKSIEEIKEDVYSLAYQLSDAEFKISNMLSRTKYGNDFAWKNPEKAYVTFTFDDCLADLSTVYSIFHSHNMPVCVACIPERLTSVADSGNTIKEVCDAIVADGGEILTHGSTAILQSTISDELIKQVFVEAKKKLVNAGYDVNGIITVGAGGSEILSDMSVFIPTLETYYDYSDAYGKNTGYGQYDNERKYITDSSWKPYIDSAIANHKVINFASHSLKGGSFLHTTAEVLTEILDYIQNKGDVIEVITWRREYDLLKTTKLEKRVSQLENC